MKNISLLKFLIVPLLFGFLGSGYAQSDLEIVDNFKKNLRQLKAQ